MLSQIWAENLSPLFLSPGGGRGGSGGFGGRGGGRGGRTRPY